MWGYFMGFHKLGIFYYKVISLTILNMGWISLSQSIEIQNLAKSPFSNVDMVWKDGFKHEG